VLGRLRCRALTACVALCADALVTHVGRVIKRRPPNHLGRRVSSMHKLLGCHIWRVKVMRMGSPLDKTLSKFNSWPL
jgi:hypothetical protein